MKQLDWKSFAIGVLLTTTVVFGVAAKIKQEVEYIKPDKCQHLAFPTTNINEFGDREFSKKINELGDAGYELLDVESITKNGNSDRRIYFFKRPKN